MIILDVLLWVENVMLWIVIETTILWIKGEYIDYNKGPEEREHWFNILPKNNIQDAATTVCM